MALETFAPPVAPGVGTGRDITADVFEATYGDGYRQRAANGVNPTRRTVTLVWDALRQADALAIVAFLEPKLKVDAFLYAVYPETTERKWTAQTLQPTEIDPLVSSLTVQLREEFDL